MTISLQRSDLVLPAIVLVIGTTTARALVPTETYARVGESATLKCGPRSTNDVSGPGRWQQMDSMLNATNLDRVRTLA